MGAPYELWYHVHDGLIPCIQNYCVGMSFSKYLITKRAPFINRLLSSQSRMCELDWSGLLVTNHSF